MGHVPVSLASGISRWVYVGVRLRRTWSVTHEGYQCVLSFGDKTVTLTRKHESLNMGIGMGTGGHIVCGCMYFICFFFTKHPQDENGNF